MSTVCSEGSTAVRKRSSTICSPACIAVVTHANARATTDRKCALRASTCAATLDAPALGAVRSRSTFTEEHSYGQEGQEAQESPVAAQQGFIAGGIRCRAAQRGGWNGW